MDWFAAQAAEPLSVPGLPGVADAASRIANEGSITGPLLILAIAAIIALSGIIWRIAHVNQVAREAAQKARDDERDEAAKELHALNNQRFIEMREMIVAVNTNTAALNVISQSQADRTASSQQIAASLGELILLTRANASALDRNLDEIRKVAWHGPARAGGGA